MVKTSYYFSFIFFILTINCSLAQRIEIGPKLRFGWNSFSANESILSPTAFDTTAKIKITSSNNIEFKLRNFLDFYVKFYPKSNNLFFAATHEVTIFNHNYKHTSVANDSLESQFRFVTRNTLLEIGYEFPKTSKHKAYILGGIKYSKLLEPTIILDLTQQVKTNEIKNSGINPKYQTELSTINSFYQKLNKHSAALMVGFGFNHGRLSEHINLSYNPFIKETLGITQSKATVQVDFFYALYHKNLSLTQYQQKKVLQQKRSKIEISSDAKFVFSVFSENGLAYIKHFKLNHTFTIKTDQGLDTIGYLKVKVDKPSLMLEMPGLGLACQVKFHNFLYFKSAFYFNRVRLGFPAGNNYSGKYFNEPGDSTQFRVLDDKNTVMNSNFKHKQLNMIIGYSNFRRYSFFAEASLQFNTWKFNSYNIMSLDKQQRRYSTDNLGNNSALREKLALKTIATTMGLTLGYKFQNILVYFQYNQSLGNLNNPNEFASIGKLSVTRFGLAYQFYKLYAKKR